MKRALALIVVGVSVIWLWADDVPPDWRGSPDSTFQHWQFPVPVPFFGGGPDEFKNPHGAPFVRPLGGRNVEWLAEYRFRAGVVRLSGPGSLSFWIPNKGEKDKHKDVWLQVTYHGFFGPPKVDIGPQKWVLVFRDPVQVGDEPWIHETQRWHLQECPEFEFVRISANPDSKKAYVDQVVIDTRCIQPH